MKFNWPIPFNPIIIVKNKIKYLIIPVSYGTATYFLCAFIPRFDFPVSYSTYFLYAFILFPNIVVKGF